jgi:hypothetical protein
MNRYLRAAMHMPEHLPEPDPGTSPGPDPFSQQIGTGPTTGGHVVAGGPWGTLVRA